MTEDVLELTETVSPLHMEAKFLFNVILNESSYLANVESI